MLERVVMVGGGAGGLATALALGRNGHPVTVLQRDAVLDDLPPRVEPERHALLEALGAQEPAA